MLRAKFLGSKKRDEAVEMSRRMDPSMYRAATSGDVGFLQAIRVGEPSSTKILSQKTPYGNNILHLAAECKQIRFFKDVFSLVEGLVWGINKMGDTPLHIAARVGCAELVDFLINQPKKIHGQEDGDQERGLTYAGSYTKLLRKTNLKMHTALHVAAQYGHLEVVTSLMKGDPKLCCSTNSAKESPLFLATCRGFFRIAAKILNEPSVSPSFQGINGVTALHAAVSNTCEGAKEIVESMVSKYPDMMKETDALGWTPLHYAAFGGNLQAVTLLMDLDKSSTSYMLDKYGMTALHVAAYKGHIEVMKKLIQYQPDTCECLNAKDQTILHVAVLGAQDDVVKYILELPELPRLIDQADEEGYTPLQLAVMGQNHEITRMLTLERGVDISPIAKGFSLIFDNFRGEDIQIEAPEENKLKEQEMSPTESSDQGKGRSFGVSSFQEQISREFKKFESHSDDKDSGSSDVAGNRKNQKSDVNLLIATLIVTVTFTAALDPPGGYGDDGKTILQGNTKFKWFSQFNFLSFYLSLLVLFYETFAARLGPRMSKVFLPFRPGNLVLFSLFGMFLALHLGSSAAQPKKTKSNPLIAVVGLVFLHLALVPDQLIRYWKKPKYGPISDSGGGKLRGVLFFLSK